VFGRVTVRKGKILKEQRGKKEKREKRKKKKKENLLLSTMYKQGCLTFKDVYSFNSEGIQ